MPNGYHVHSEDQYCLLRIGQDFTLQRWEDQEQATRRVSDLIHESEKDYLVADLSELQELPSSVVTSLIRAWNGLNERRRRLVVVTQSDQVQSDLAQSGLLKSWKVLTTMDGALDFLGVSPGQSGLQRLDPNDLLSADFQSPEDPLAIVQKKGYSAITFYPALMNMAWADVEQQTTNVVNILESLPTTDAVVDLNRMEHINSGLVAAIVRIWKSVKGRSGHFSVVSENENVTEVLQHAGLWKLWAITDSREEAVFELGVSRAHQAEIRERKMLPMIAVPSATIAVFALLLMYLDRKSVLGVNAQLTALLFASAAIATGLISALKDDGLRQRMSLGAVLAGLLVLSTLWFKENPISFGKRLPDRDFDRATERANHPANQPERAKGEENSQSESEEPESALESKRPGGEKPDRVGDIVLEQLKEEGP